MTQLAVFEKEKAALPPYVQFGHFLKSLTEHFDMIEEMMSTDTWTEQPWAVCAAMEGLRAGIRNDAKGIARELHEYTNARDDLEGLELHCFDELIKNK